MLIRKPTDFYASSRVLGYYKLKFKKYSCTVPTPAYLGIEGWKWTERRDRKSATCNKSLVRLQKSSSIQGNRHELGGGGMPSGTRDWKFWSGKSAMDVNVGGGDGDGYVLDHINCHP